MQFNPDLNIQGNEVYFSWKSNTDDYIHVKLSDSLVQLCESQKHLGVILDKHLNFHEHIDRKNKTCNKLTGTIKHLSVPLRRKFLLTIYKSFVWPHLDYGDIIYDNSEKKSVINKLEKVQYLACLAITGAFKACHERVFIRNVGLNLYKVGGGVRKWYFLKNIKWSNTKILIWYYTCIKWKLLQYKSSIKVETYSIL